MQRWTAIGGCVSAVVMACSGSPGPAVSGPPAEAAAPAASPAVEGPRYTAAGELLPPTDYREWVFLTSGFSMAYGPAAAEMAAAGIKMMDNVYVPRAAYAAFRERGTWPDGTMFVLEIRAGEGTGSIVDGGHFQTYLAGLEAHVIDSKRYPGGSGFFGFPTDDAGPSGPAKPLPSGNACAACHTKNGAVGNTFTQFYPTLFPIARAKGTVRDDFVGIPATPSELVAEVGAHGWKAGERLLDQTGVKWPAANLVREAALNVAGYRLIAAGHAPEGISLFEYVTRRHPGSANAWESLSEAYEKAGRADQARAATERGLHALATDRGAPAMHRQALDRALRERKARLASPAAPASGG
jgi:Cytochrome P460